MNFNRIRVLISAKTEFIFTELLGGESKTLELFPAILTCTQASTGAGLDVIKRKSITKWQEFKGQTQPQCSQWQSSLSQSIDFSPSKEKIPFLQLGRSPVRDLHK